MKLLKNSLLVAAIAMVAVACGKNDRETVDTGDAQDVSAMEGTSLDVADGTQIMWKGFKGLGEAVIYSHQGTVNMTEGSVTVNDGALVGGKFTFDLMTLDVTDDPEQFPEEKQAGLAGHLLTTDFFGVFTTNENHEIVDTTEANATITFEITGVSEYTAPAEGEGEKNEWSTAAPTHNVTGNLTIKGISKSITFPAHVEVAEGSVSASAKFFIDRQKWNITFMAGDAGVVEAGKDQFIKNEMGIGFDFTAGGTSMDDAAM